jgi:hypothetical protein
VDPSCQKDRDDLRIVSLPLAKEAGWWSFALCKQLIALREVKPYMPLPTFVQAQLHGVAKCAAGHVDVSLTLA